MKQVVRFCSMTLLFCKIESKRQTIEKKNVFLFCLRIPKEIYLTINWWRTDTISVNDAELLAFRFDRYRLLFK